MKPGLIILLLTFAVSAFSQGDNGHTDDCAPMKDGKVVYTDTVDMEDFSRQEIFDNVLNWAKKTYDHDRLLSNVTSNLGKGTVSILSKIGLELADQDSTVLKYRMEVTCYDAKYELRIYNLRFEYDPTNRKSFKSYPAEDILADNGKGNKVEAVKDPETFCEAAFFFAQRMFGEVYLGALDESEEPFISR